MNKKSTLPQDEAPSNAFTTLLNTHRRGIPLFEHGDRYKLGARLRFVIQGGSVKFRLLFTNLQDAKEQEFERIVQEIEKKTSQPIYRGRLALPW